LEKVDSQWGYIIVKVVYPFFVVVVVLKIYLGELPYMVLMENLFMLYFRKIKSGAYQDG